MKNILFIVIAFCIVSCVGKQTNKKQIDTATNIKKADTTLVSNGDAEPQMINWDSIHAIYTHATYANMKDEWMHAGIFNVYDSEIPDSIRTKLEQLTVSFDHDTITVGGKYKAVFEKKKVKRSELFSNVRDSYYDFYTQYLSIRGIDIKDSVPYLHYSSYDTSAKVLSFEAQIPFWMYTEPGGFYSVCTSKYFFLTSGGCVSCYELIKKQNQSAPRKNAKIICTSTDYAGRKEIPLSEHALEIVTGAKVFNTKDEDAPNVIDNLFLFPDYKSYGVLMTEFDAGDFMENTLCVSKNGRIEMDANKGIDFTDWEDLGAEEDADYTNVDFAIYDDYTILKRIEEKKNKITTVAFQAYRINDDGEFYELVRDK